jgi:hypothetical protein
LRGFNLPDRALCREKKLEKIYQSNSSRDLQNKKSTEKYSILHANDISALICSPSCATADTFGAFSLDPDNNLRLKYQI